MTRCESVTLAAACALCTLLLAGCYGGGTSATAGLEGLPGALTIRIEDDWTGLSPVAPIEAHYDLRRSGDGFEGRAEFSVAGYSEDPITATETITVPGEAAAGFLSALETTPLKRGTYSPTQTHTDDYPSVTIEVEVAEGTVVFSSTSQGEGMAPWSVDVMGQDRISASTVPADALESIRPYLKKDVLDALIEQAQER